MKPEIEYLIVELRNWFGIPFKTEEELDKIDIQKGQIVLDFGCGTGSFSLPVARSSRKGNISFCWPREDAFCFLHVLIFKKGAHKDAMEIGRYLLSDEVQGLISGAGLIPVNPNVPLPEQA